MSSNKFLGVCIVIAAFLIAAAIVYARPARRVGRYQFHASSPSEVILIIDTTTGESQTVVAARKAAQRRKMR